MSNQPPTTFDYRTLDEETRLFIQQKADETHGLLKRTAEHVLRIGQNLRAIKEKLPHGQFLPWVEAEFGMSRWTVRNFMNVADKLEAKWGIFHHLPVSVLYELAAPSTSEDVLSDVEAGLIPPNIEAVKDAKEAERLAKEAEQQAHSETESVRRELSNVRDQIQAKQTTIEHLTQEMTRLQQQIASLSSPTVEIKEVEKHVVPPDVIAQLEQLQQQLRALTQQRDALTQQVIKLGEEAKTASMRRNEGEQERRIRLNWYKVTTEFQNSVIKLLAQWPSSLDTLAFEADDWTRLSQTKELARRLLDECTALTERKIVNGTTEPLRERTG